MPSRPCSGLRLSGVGEAHQNPEQVLGNTVVFTEGLFRDLGPSQDQLIQDELNERVETVHGHFELRVGVWVYLIYSAADLHIFLDF